MASKSERPRCYRRRSVEAEAALELVGLSDSAREFTARFYAGLEDALIAGLLAERDRRGIATHIPDTQARTSARIWARSDTEPPIALEAAGTGRMAA